MSSQPFRLRAGDLVLFERKACRVLRVNDCAAVLAVSQSPRTFTTRWGKAVSLQPKPAFVRISPNSEAEILSRPTP